MNQNDQALLAYFAQKYIWWKSSSESAQHPERIIIQVMNIGDYDDVLHLIKCVGEDVLRDVLKKAEIGQFNEKSWHYWHYRLNLATLGQVPHLPNNRFQ